MPATPVIRRHRAARSLLVAGFAPIFAMGAWLAPAAAAEGDESRSGARFLDGEVFGTDLDEIAELAGVDVENLGSPAPVIDANPLDVTVLDSLNVTIPGGLQLPLSDIIQLGAVNQWAAAADGGVSHAATGAVADNGGVGTGVDAGFPGNATFDLTDLLGDGLTDLIADVELELGAVSSEAHLMPNEAGDDFDVMRDYEIAGGKLVITIPLLNNPLLPPLDLGDGISIANGVITIDFEALGDGLGLNDRAPNTLWLDGLVDILNDTLLDTVAAVPVVGPIVAGLLQGVFDTLELDGIGDALSGLLSIKLNVQPDQPDPASDVSAAAATSEEYSVAAIEITLLGGLEGGAQVTLAESHVGPNVIADAPSETEVDGTETEVDGTEVDGTEVDGTETEVDGTETEVDGTETEVDGTETEVDGTEVDGTETDADAGGAENGDDGGELPDTGSGSSQLLVLGLALMLAGGIAAYAVSRRRELTQE